MKGVKRQRGGFSLTELLVALFITGLLVVLVTIAVQAVRERTETAICANYMRQYHALLDLYAALDSGQYPVMFYEDDPKYPFELTPAYRFWTQGLERYGLIGLKQLNGLACPGNDGEPYHRDLTCKYLYSKLAGYHPVGQGSATKWVRHSRDYIVNPSQFALLTDAAVMEDWSNPRCAYSLAKETWQDEVGFTIHGHKANVLFADGHLEHVAPEAFNPLWLDPRNGR